MTARTFVVLLTGVLLAPFIGWLIVTPVPFEYPPAPWYPADSSFSAVVIRPEDGVALPSAAGAALPFCSRRSPAGVVGFWRADAATVSQVETDLARFLPAAAALEPWNALRRPSLETYKRQYLGLRYSTGANGLLVNAFAAFPALWYAPNPKGFWQVRLASVCDGGTNYWSVEYDPARRAFRGFTHDGFG